MFSLLLTLTHSCSGRSGTMGYICCTALRDCARASLEHAAVPTCCRDRRVHHAGCAAAAAERTRADAHDVGPHRRLGLGRCKVRFDWVVRRLTSAVVSAQHRGVLFLRWPLRLSQQLGMRRSLSSADRASWLQWPPASLSVFMVRKFDCSQKRNLLLM